MSLMPFFKLNYWFGETPSLRRETLVIYLVALGLLFLFGLVCKYVASKRGMSGAQRLALRRFGTLGITGALLGLLLLFLRYEQVPFFTLRFWFGLLGVFLLVWIGRIILKSKIKYQISK